jgi:hypothetical protein
MRVYVRPFGIGCPSIAVCPLAETMASSSEGYGNRENSPHEHDHPYASMSDAGPRDFITPSILLGVIVSSIASLL